MGVSFIDASGEADELCVQLVVKQIAWGCMSEDMDMVVHGCHHDHVPREPQGDSQPSISRAIKLGVFLPRKMRNERS